MELSANNLGKLAKNELYLCIVLPPCALLFVPPYNNTLLELTSTERPSVAATNHPQVFFLQQVKVNYSPNSTSLSNFILYLTLSYRFSIFMLFLIRVDILFPKWRCTIIFQKKK